MATTCSSVIITRGCLIQKIKNLFSVGGARCATTPNVVNAEGRITEVLADRIRWAANILAIVPPETRRAKGRLRVEYAKRFPD